MTDTLQDIEDLARYALEDHGLAPEWQFRWDRARQRAGACHHGKRLITLSRPIFAIPENRYDALDTILHEIAHAIAGPSANHGPEWQAAARSLGATPETCHTLTTPPSRLVGTCECGPVHERERQPSGYRICIHCEARVTYTLRTS